jgi:hypothetical protein
MEVVVAALLLRDVTPLDAPDQLREELIVSVCALSRMQRPHPGLAPR